MRNEVIEHGVKLTPVQSAAKAAVRKGLEVSPILALGGDTGRGKSTVLAQLHSELGGSLLGISDLLKETSARHPLALEESVFEVVLGALKRADVVIVDHFDIVVQTVCCHHGIPECDGSMGPASRSVSMRLKPARSSSFLIPACCLHPYINGQFRPELPDFEQKITRGWR